MGKGIIGRKYNYLDGGFESLDLKKGSLSRSAKKIEKILITLTLADS